MSCPIKHPTCHRETEKVCPTLAGPNVKQCWLGNEAVAYTLRPRTDGKIDLTLSLTHRLYLVFLAAPERQGKGTYDYTQVKEETRDHMRKLAGMGLILEIPIIGSPGRVEHKLTDAGWNIVGQIEKAQGVSNAW